jgi:hypothetical protein
VLYKLVKHTRLLLVQIWSSPDMLVKIFYHVTPTESQIHSHTLAHIQTCSCLKNNFLFSTTNVHNTNVDSFTFFHFMKIFNFHPNIRWVLLLQRVVHTAQYVTRAELPPSYQAVSEEGHKNCQRLKPPKLQCSLCYRTASSTGTPSLLPKGF